METLKEKVAREYGDLKEKLSDAHRGDRVSYTEAKTDFIRDVTEKAKKYFGEAQPSPACDVATRAAHED